MALTLLRHTHPQLLHEAIDAPPTDVGQRGNLRGLEVEREQPKKLPHFRLGEM